MSSLVYLVPTAIMMGGLGLLAFIWAMKNNQYDDPDGASHRILESEDKPL